MKEKKILSSIILLAAALFLQLAARCISGFGEWYGRRIYPLLVRFFGLFFGRLPFSVSEWGLYLLLLAGLGYGIALVRRCARREMTWRQGFEKLAGTSFCAVALLACSYTVNCGVNYYRKPFSAYLDLEIRESSVEELEQLCAFLAEQVQKTSQELMDRQGTVLPDETERAGFPQQARADMIALGQRYPQLAGYYPLPKPVAMSQILSVQSLSGVYSPFTIEANYNDDMTAYNIPHTACHELSHLKGFMREEEANFIGYLACVGSESLYSRYSGYVSGFIYANNALYRQAPEQAARLQAGLPEEVRRDMQENNAFWTRYEGRVSEAVTRVNDTYLKVNSQAEGVKSYGRVVDLMLAYHRREPGT